jgi:hypothetical protein
MWEYNVGMNTQISPNARRALAESGEFYLKVFHSEYEKDPVGPRTEFRRGQFTGWKQTLFTLYSRAAAEEIIEGVSDRTRLSVPPAGELSEDGKGYLGTDLSSHMGFIGKLA